MSYKDKEVQREYQRRWCQQRRRDWFADKVCVSCGEDDYKILTLHHKDRKTKVSHRIWSWSLDRIAVETAKCEVRCANCHALVELELVQPCGTRASYVRGCDCADCKSANVAYELRRRVVKNDTTSDTGVASCMCVLAQQW